MPEDLAEIIRALPAEAFREPPDRLAGMTHLERLRWLQQTACFVWKHKGAAQAERREDTGGKGDKP
jgi:hypothetical protein